MGNCANCDSSSSTYSRCNPPLSSNCLFYQGSSLVCTNDNTFRICKGDSLTDIQIEIFNKICSILGNTDVSSIEIPVCLTQAWDSSDLSIFNLFTLLLQEHCNLQNSLTSLTDSLVELDPQVNVCLACCEETGCNISAKIYLSDALNKIVACICRLKAEVSGISNDLANLKTSYNTVVTQLSDLQASVNILITNQPTILTRLNCIETRIDNTPEVPASC